MVIYCNNERIETSLKLHIATFKFVMTNSGGGPQICTVLISGEKPLGVDDPLGGGVYTTPCCYRMSIEKRIFPRHRPSQYCIGLVFSSIATIQNVCILRHAHSRLIRSVQISIATPRDIHH